MPRIKKATVIDKVEIEPIVPQEEELSSITPVAATDNKDSLKTEKNKKKITKEITPEIQAPVTEVHKEKFKQLHMEDTYWLENAIYQTIADMTEGKKGAKALIINQALKDYFEKNDVEIKPLRVKGKKD